VMPHNLFLHSGVVQTRRFGDSVEEKREAINLATVDSTIHLDDGDSLVLYTDGITEAMNSRRQQFDIARLGAVVEAAAADSVEHMRDRIVSAVRLWMVSQNDDMSVVVARHSCG